MALIVVAELAATLNLLRGNAIYDEMRYKSKLRRKN